MRAPTSPPIYGHCVNSQHHRRAPLAVALLAASGCRAPPRCADGTPRPESTQSCPVPGFQKRLFDLDLPPSWNGSSPLPVIVAFHGGGGNRAASERVTCPDGNPSDPRCFTSMARQRGYAVVRPDGSGARLVSDIRTWNAGGGVRGLNCTSGRACKDGIDDVAYFDALMQELSQAIPVDSKRVFLTGLSNGGAISHRLACERPNAIAAIAAVGGENQFAAAGGVCTAPVAVLDIHGTEDPCWTYAASDASCLPGDGGVKTGAAASLEGWRLRNGCGATPTETMLDDADPKDGTRVVRVSWPSCAAALEHLRIEGGGHTWPNGFSYFGESRIGRVTRDVGSEVILDFFDANPKP